jgi:hypothetical protein
VELYNNLKVILEDCAARERNFRKSQNHRFQHTSLVESRERAIRRKLRALDIAKKLIQSTDNPDLLSKIRAKRTLIIELSERILGYIRQRLVRHKNGSYDCVEFVSFFANLENNMAHLPELREIKDSTSIRDFLAAIQAHHDTLSDVGKPQLITFVINAKMMGSAKTRERRGKKKWRQLQLTLKEIEK